MCVYGLWIFRLSPPFSSTLSLTVLLSSYLLPGHCGVDVAVDGWLVESEGGVLYKWELIQVQFKEMLP